jgi:hypothetical protein
MNAVLLRAKFDFECSNQHCVVPIPEGTRFVSIGGMFWLCVPCAEALRIFLTNELAAEKRTRVAAGRMK